MNFGALPALSLSMVLAGCFCVLFGVVMIAKREKISFSAISKYFRIGTDSTSRSTGRGEAKLVPLILTIVCCLVIVTVPVTIALAKYFSRYPIYTLENVQVVSEETGLPGYSYWMIYNSESSGPLKFFARFCDDYKPPFDPGDYLEFVRYEDRRECWSLKSEYAGVKIRRDSHGRTDSEITNERTR